MHVQRIIIGIEKGVWKNAYKGDQTRAKGESELQCPKHLNQKLSPLIASGAALGKLLDLSDLDFFDRPIPHLPKINNECLLPKDNHED